MNTYMFKDQPGAMNCVQQQQLSHTLPLTGAVYRQPPKPNARHLPGKSFRQFHRKFLS